MNPSCSGTSKIDRAYHRRYKRTPSGAVIDWAGVGNNELHSESETLEGSDFAAQISDSIIVHQNAVGL